MIKNSSVAAFNFPTYKVINLFHYYATNNLNDKKVFTPKQSYYCINNLDLSILPVSNRTTTKNEPDKSLVFN